LGIASAHFTTDLPLQFLLFQVDLTLPKCKWTKQAYAN
jgi:hypothetical protein